LVLKVSKFFDTFFPINFGRRAIPPSKNCHTRNAGLLRESFEIAVVGIEGGE